MIATCSTEAGAASYNDKSGITAVKMDMVDEAEVKAVAAQLARAHPEGLYCLVNNNNNTGEICGRNQWGMCVETLCCRSCADARSIPDLPTPTIISSVAFLPLQTPTTAVGKDGLVEWMDIDDYKFQMEVNLYGFIRVTKAFLPLLKVGG